MQTTFAAFKQIMKKNTGMKISVLVLLLFSAIFLQLQSLPAYASISRISPESPDKDSLTNTTDTRNNSFYSLYEGLELASMGLSRRAFEYAINGLEQLIQKGHIQNDDVISIVDFSLPSSAKRLFVIDLANNKLLFCTYVAHGNGSGLEYANRFSNIPQSNKSSLGFYKTLNTYMGGHGYSLKLEGLERGINDNANRRDIVIHGAAYVSEALARSQGYIGRSQGCPALPEKIHKPIINTIKNGTCLFIYSPDRAYLKKSKILNSRG